MLYPTALLVLTALSAALSLPLLAQETPYHRPPAVIEEVALATSMPKLQISPDNQWVLQLDRIMYRSIAKLARPELKLAGFRINHLRDKMILIYVHAVLG